jgi:uncharacterized membrane protein
VTRRVWRGLLIAAFLFAGVLHVVRPGFFLPIVPDWVPAPRLTVIMTGWCELAGAVGLLIPRFRRQAGIMLAVYVACVFPANIKHAILDLGSGTGLDWSYHLPRLLVQPVIAWWCLVAGEVLPRPSKPKP